MLSPTSGCLWHLARAHRLATVRRSSSASATLSRLYFERLIPRKERRNGALSIFDFGASEINDEDFIMNDRSNTPRRAQGEDGRCD
jgi:hypothetical protein